MLPCLSVLMGWLDSCELLVDDLGVEGSVDESFITLEIVGFPIAPRAFVEDLVVVVVAVVVVIVGRILVSLVLELE